MSRMCVAILWSSIIFITGKASCRENEVSAITGCNATLEWRIGSDYAEAVAHSIKVFNAKGIQIAEKEGNKCKNVSDTSTYCGVRKTSSKEWRFSVVLFNITQDDSGNYTGQIKFGPKYEANITTVLMVIDKPQITEGRLPILNESFHITCAVESEFKDKIYNWKINGMYLISTERIRTESSNLMFERITLEDRFTIFSCRVCTDINCCIESDTYVIDPFYGPNNVTLSLNNSNIYLRLNETFKVMCSAKCNPACTIFWKGSMGSENETLVINSFNSSMVGDYICIAKNNKTGVTVKSDSIFLYVQDASTVSYSHGDNGDLQCYWIGPVIISVFLLFVGSLIFVTHWCKKVEGVDSRKLRDAEYDRWPYRIGVSAKRNRLIQLLTKLDWENNAANEGCDTDTQSQDLNNLRQENAEPNLQEDIHNIIDDTVLSIYDYARDNVIGRNTHATESSTQHEHYENVPSMCHVETAHVHVTYEDYVTPINDPDIPIEVYDNGEVDILGRDQAYITPICDLACPIELCQDVETDVLKIDETYITPISE